MQNKKIEVEGNELLIESNEGHYAIIPKQDREVVQKMIDEGCDDCINNYIKRLPLDSDYAEDGSLMASPNTPPPLASQKYWYYTDKKKIKELSEFLFDIDFDNLRQDSANSGYTTLKRLNKEAERCIQKDSEGRINCAGTAYNAHVNMVSSKIGTPHIRDLLYRGLDEAGGVANTKYSMPSKAKDGVYRHNSSLDSWEAPQKLIDEGGIVIFDSSVQDIDDFDFTRIPLGSVIYTGEAKHRYTKESAPSHTITAVGFGKDGIPIIADYGEIRRITDPKYYGLRGFKKIIIPKGYQHYTYDKIKRDLATYERELGYFKDATLAPVNTQYKEIQQAEEFLNDKVKDVGRFYGIPKETMTKLKNRALSIGIKETKLNNTLSKEDLKKLGFEASLGGVLRDVYTEIFRGNKVGQAAVSTVKGAMNAVKLPVVLGQSLMEKVLDRKLDDIPDYKLELEIYKELEKQGVEKPEIDEMTEKLFNELSSKRVKKAQLSRTDASAGAFSIKDLPKYAERKNLKKDYLLSGGRQDELNKGLEIATAILAEKYNQVKASNDKELTDDQIIDLITVGYSNQSKFNDPEFVDYSIKTDRIKDIELDKIKRYEKWLQTGE